MKVYIYKNCSTCKNAIKWLDNKGVNYELKPIRETPPSVKELKQMLGFQNGNIKKLFNASGMDYRALNMKEKMPALSEDELLELLSQNGNLVKRPFLLSKDRGLVGFKQADWEAAWGE